MPKRIVLISSGQPSLNPRLVKEADTLADAGYDVTVLYAYWNNWGTKLDKELIPSKKWKAICVGGDPEQDKITYFLSRLIHKAALAINHYTRGKRFADLAISRPAYFLTKKAQEYPADLYIGHNLGALPATAKAAQKNKVKCGFDAEDFHRNETDDDTLSYPYLLSKRVEDNYLPAVDYLTTASPLISAEYQKLYPAIKNTTINNCFNTDPEVTIHPDDKVKLFWFSQTIGANRGLEDAIEAMCILDDSLLELHLLGNAAVDIKSNFTARFNDKQSRIYFHTPMASNKIIPWASQFDIGLALEMKTPFNRNICLTNKIYTYLQAGMAVIASDTLAQKDFMDKWPQTGKLYPTDNAQALAGILSGYLQNREMLSETRKASLKLAYEELNWETESKKFLQIIEQTLKSD